MYDISHLIEFSCREPSGAVSVVIVDVHCEMIKYCVCLVLFVRIIEFKTRNYPSQQGYIFCFSRHWLLNLKKRERNTNTEKSSVCPSDLRLYRKANIFFKKCYLQAMYGKWLTINCFWRSCKIDTKIRSCFTIWKSYFKLKSSIKSSK